jgi:hypothetical protein
MIASGECADDAQPNLARQVQPDTCGSGDTCARPRSSPSSYSSEQPAGHVPASILLGERTLIGPDPHGGTWSRRSSPAAPVMSAMVETYSECAGTVHRPSH